MKYLNREEKVECECCGLKEKENIDDNYEIENNRENVSNSENKSLEKN